MQGYAPTPARASPAAAKRDCDEMSAFLDAFLVLLAGYVCSWAFTELVIWLWSREW